MANRGSRTTKKLATQSFELAMAAPLVVAHRLTRMALAGSTPSARDREEFLSMGTEKVAAFGQAWNAMALQTLRAQQELTLGLWRNMFKPWWMWSSPKSLNSNSRRAHNAALRVVSEGVTPIHRKAVSNARRLGRTPLK